MYYDTNMNRSKKPHAAYLYDTHVHTSESSPCGRLNAQETVRLYSQAGFSGFCITDHYTRDFFETISGPWSNKARWFLRGYETAHAEGEKIGFAVFLGMEIRLDEGISEYLVLGVNQYFIQSNPELYRFSLAELSQIVRDADLLLIQAHPFRESMRPQNMIYLDGIEAYNGNPRFFSDNSRAMHLCKENGIRGISGSDCHRLNEVATGGILVKRPLQSEDGLVREIKSGNYLNFISSSERNEAYEKLSFRRHDRPS
ncbi:MAG: PHP domain-containing protein [Christensenellales bacterium]|jgi:hypothetical protein